MSSSNDAHPNQGDQSYCMSRHDYANTAAPRSLPRGFKGLSIRPDPEFPQEFQGVIDDLIDIQRNKPRLGEKIGRHFLRAYVGIFDEKGHKPSYYKMVFDRRDARAKITIDSDPEGFLKDLRTLRSAALVAIKYECSIKFARQRIKDVVRHHPDLFAVYRTRTSTIKFEDDYELPPEWFNESGPPASPTVSTTPTLNVVARKDSASVTETEEVTDSEQRSLDDSSQSTPRKSEEAGDSAPDADEPVNIPLDAALDSFLEQIAGDEELDPDRRERAQTLLVIRQGQQQFRDNLVAIYGGQCAVTNCRVKRTLEAAHIRPYKGQHTNHVSNGLLLRADIHKLFDRHLLGVDGTGRIRLSEAIRDSQYAALEGIRLSALPNPELDSQRRVALAQHFAKCGMQPSG